MYRELSPLSPLREHVRCVWEHRLPAVEQTGPGQSPRSVVIVPDACVDLVWDGRSVHVAGPDTRFMRQAVRANASFLGLRFRTGAASNVLGMPMSALRDCRIELGVLWPEAARRLEDTLPGLADQRALAVLQQTTLHRRGSWAASDPLVTGLVALLRSRFAQPELRVSGLARELGVSERQLLRRCTTAVGYGPKLLARILRLQAFTEALALHPSRALIRLAAELGYADQAHLCHDALELHGSTPSALRARALARAVSVLDKTVRPAVRQAAPHEQDDLSPPRR